MDLDLKDAVVLISGAARGIGAASSRAFAAEGARLALVDRDEAATLALAESLGKGGAAVEPIVEDLADPDACQRVIRRTIERFGRLDVLVNNAGGNDSVGLERSPADFARSVLSNLLHVYALAHYARPLLRASHGSIVNVSSKVSLTGQGGTSGYAAAKGAINALTREWALDLAGEGVRVNCVVPAECLTDQYERWFNAQPDPAAAQAAVARLVPLGARMTTGEEVAAAIVFLASPRSSHTTGQLVFVDGGYTHLDRAATHGHAKWSAP